MKRLSLLTRTSFLLVLTFTAQVLHADKYNTVSVSYILEKFKTNDIVFLGTSHQEPSILNFISNLIPELNKAGVSHICLEVPSDQQNNIDHIIQTGEGLSQVGVVSRNPRNF